MKRNITYYIIYFFLIILIGCWIFQNRLSINNLDYLTVFFASISVLFALRQFRLNTTFNKLNALTINPEASEFCVQINCYLNAINDIDQPKNVTRKDIEKNIKLNVSIHFILGYFDDIAVGIKNGTISEKLTKEITGNYIVKIATGLKPYIEELDNYYGDKHYLNLLWLSSRWQK